MKLLRRWRELTRAEKRTLFAVACWSTLLRVALAVTSWPFVRRRLARRRRGNAEPNVVAWALSVCERRIPWTTCLSLSLTAQLLLGDESAVRIGAWRDDDGVMRFHASVICDGRELWGGREMTTLAAIE